VASQTVAGWQAAPNTADAGGHSASQFMATLPQQRLYFLPEPQGQGSFRPTLGALWRGSGVNVVVPAWVSLCTRKY
jgi:hypothetical protein